MTRSWFILALLLLAGCMERAKPQPQILQRTPSLYHRLGGAAKLDRIADSFLAAVDRADGIKEPIKEAFRDDPEERKKAFVRHLGAAAGGPQQPSRKGIWAAFDGVPLEEADRAPLLAALDRALAAQEIGKRTRGEVLALFAEQN
jgi:truncated hemoglobin YjbI